MSCTGFESACGKTPPHPLPKGWLGRADATIPPPAWAKIPPLSDQQLRCLLAQISYDTSNWNYELVGPNNELGRYQFSTQLLELYGVIAQGSNAIYGNDCVNYRHVWQPASQVGTNDYLPYLCNVTSLYNFLNNASAQEFLAYRLINDLYNVCVINCAIQYQGFTSSDWQPNVKYYRGDIVKYNTKYYTAFDDISANTNFYSPPWQEKTVQQDTADVIAGMLYVAWTLGVGSPPTPFEPNGSGAWAWRYGAVGAGDNSFNSGRYAVEILS